MKAKRIFLFIILGLCIMFSGCDLGINVEPTITDIYKVTLTPRLTSTQAQIVSPTWTPSPKETQTQTPTITQTPTMTDTPAPTNTPTIPTPDSTLPATCGTVSIGKAVSQSQEKNHKIVIQGIAILCAQVYLESNTFWHIPIPEGTLDLDTGDIGISDEADIKFYASGGTDIFYDLYAINHAKGVPWALFLNDNGEIEYPPEPTFEDCYNKIDTYASGDNSPTYVCLLTGSENVTRVKVEEWDPLGNKAMSVKISFVTWEK